MSRIPIVIDVYHVGFNISSPTVLDVDKRAATSIAENLEMTAMNNN